MATTGHAADGWMNADQRESDASIDADEIEMRRDLDAFGGGRPYTYDHATGHVTWADGAQASVWRDEGGTFRAAEINRQEVAP